MPWRLWIFCLAIATFRIIESVDVDPFESQPKITIRNGHISFNSGRNGNISFASTGQGTIQINGVDLGQLTKRINSAHTESQSKSLPNAQVDSLLQRIISLEDRATGLEDNVTSLNQKLTRFLGRGQDRISNRGLRRALSKVKLLTEKYNTLSQLLAKDECLNNPCKNGGTCFDSYNKFFCHCPDNWEGTTCEEDVNECARFAGTSFGCKNGATCVNTPGGYRCDCSANWYGVHCTEKLDDCNSASHQELCGHGTCINEQRVVPGQPRYRCICDAGWQKASNSPACTEDIDECSGPNRKCSQNPMVACINLPGTFHCGHCPAGYTGNGVTCSDINECEVNNGGCSQQPFVQCANTIGSRSCGPCPTGYVGNGVQCTYVGVCSVSRGGCHPLATCTENMAVTGTYRVCTCPPGYIGNGEGLTGCVQSTSPMSCATNPCQHGTCQMVGQTIHCQCEPGYFGTLCDHQEIDPCASSPCQNGGTCTRIERLGPDIFSCKCTRSYMGPTCARGRVCTSHSSGNNGTWTYPEHDQPFTPPGCGKMIRVETNKVIQLNFTEFNIGADCSRQYLNIFNDYVRRTLFGKFCNQDLQNQIINTTTNYVYLWFSSSSLVAGTRLTVKWTAIDPTCGGTLNVSEYGVVNTPNYPRNYTQNMTCEWLVRVPFGKRILFQFATVKLEQHENCSYDYLKILDGATHRDPVIGQYCTTTTPPPLTTSGHSAIVVFHSDLVNQDTGFHITYSSQPTIQGCGGILTNGTGVFSSPNFPDVYQNNLICEWLIRIHPDNRIMLTFKEFHLEHHINCLFDYLEIFDGEDDSGPLLGRYCGADLPGDLLTNSHKLFLRFRSDTSLARDGFKIEYRTICGGVFTESTGILQSPYYPDNYPSKAKCIFNIQAPSGNLIKLTFQTLDIEVHESCRYDYVEIRDGAAEDSPSLAKLCGTDVPEPIVSTYNFLYMLFETDGNVENKGFYANYEFMNVGCGGVLTSSEGSLGSPLHPDRYPHSITCSWYLKAPPGYVIQLTFQTFLLESDGMCRYDYVIVEEQLGRQIGRYCGNTKPPVLTSMDNSLFVKFVADSSVSRDGFTATYKFLNAQESCSVTYYQESGVIRSPGYPERYPHNAHCVWVIQAPTSQQVSLNVTTFTLEEHQTCMYDYLEIRNGGFLSSPLIGRYCSHQSIPFIRSHSNALRLEFVTDGSMSAPGFEIYYDSLSTGCGGKLTSPRGTIVSPNFPQAYPMNADCEWLIQVSAGSVISLVFVEIDIEEHAVCHYDYVQVFDGASENSKTLVKICNNQQIHGPITSTGNSVLIRFKSDTVKSAGGFQLAYQTLCNNKLTKRRGVIESPNFPNSYPHNHNCSWRIEAPKGNNITMSFSHLRLETSDSCDVDYVELIEVNSRGDWIDLGKFCGNTSKPPANRFETGSNVAIVRLVTDQSVSREGFRLEYVMDGCGGEIVNKPFGTISSPNYPNGYPFETECIWQISYTPGSKVELTIHELDLENTPECIYDYLRVYGGEDDTSVELVNLCTRASATQVVTTNGNHMYIKFHSDASITSRGFQATFKQIEDDKCGGKFTAAEGTITSPNYPKTYTVRDDCEWLIEVDRLHTAVLEFYDFNLPESEGCVNGYVAIHDGDSSSAPLLAKYCGTQKPENQTIATGNVMLVRLVTDGINVGRGFRAHYKRGCGQRFLADEGGEITSPNYPDISYTISNCSWILYTTQPEKVSLVITHMHLRDDNNCSSSALILSDGDMPDSPVIGQYCGTRSPPAVISRGSTLHVLLVNVGIFQAVYGVASTHCGGDFSSVHGTFTSPGYPYNYPEVTECVWTIQASKGNKVHLSFEQFKLEDSEYCNKDYVEIHENNAAGRFIGRFCGHHVPSNLTSAEKLWIKFKSNDITTDNGFLAHYELEHGAVLNASEGEIMSPGYPHRFHERDDFTWTVYVPSGLTVSLTFVKIDIVSISTTRSCVTFVQMFDGFDEDAPELGKFCGFQIPEPVLSTGNVVFIKYHATEFWTGSFHLRWNSVTSSGISVDIPLPGSGDTCMEEMQVNSTGEVVITSPNYPQNYPDAYNCSYYLRASHYQHINMNVTDLHLESNMESCRFDSLGVYYLNDANVNDWTLNRTLCDRQSNVLFSSPTNLMKLVFSTDNMLNFRGFKAVAKASCGAHLKQSSGVIKSDDFRAELTSLQSGKTFECEYFITVKPRRTIQINIENFNFPSDAVCTTNYLKLGNGESSLSPPLGNGKFCGSSVPQSFETDSNHAYVKIVVSSLTGGTPEFTLKFSEVSQGCGGTYFLSEQAPYYEVMSPNYPSPPSHDIECEWTVMSPPGTRMRMDFDSEFHMSPDNCFSTENSEYLELMDGASLLSPPLHRFCGHEQPSSVMSTGNALLVHYVTAVENPQAGFKAKIGISECGGTIASFGQVIKSPNYPNAYGNSLNCEWNLRMSQGYHLTLTVDELATPTPSVGQNCSSTDYLEVRFPDAQGSVLAMLCGNVNKHQINVPGPTAYMRFISNSARTGKGFTMLMHGDFDEGCSGHLEGTSGTITSPKYPNAVQGARSCYWRINAPEGRSVKLIFDEFNLPKDEAADLCLSYVSVYNVTQWVNSEIKPHKICGDSLPAPIESSSSSLGLSYYSPGVTAGQGFSLHFSTDDESICGGVLPLPFGEITTPNFTVDEFGSMDCKWRIDGDLANQTIVFRFDVMDLPGIMADYCRKGLLYFTADRFYIGRFCGNYSSEVVITSPFPSTVLRVVTSLSQPARLLHGTYNVSNCGGVLQGEDIEIYSPQYPQGYPPNTDCHWVVRAHSGVTVSLHFEDLELEDDCTKDYVIIRNGYHLSSPTLAKLCGKKTPHTITSSSGVLSVIFHSDAFGSAKGFKIVTHEVQMGCGGVIHMKKGNFSSPNFPSHYTDNVECIWTIDYVPGYVVQLEYVDRFDIEVASSCQKDYLKIEEYIGGEWVDRGKKCGRQVPDPFIGKSNKVKVTFVSDGSVSGDGFNIKYSAVCGGNFTDETGFIVSPNYPDLYDNFLNCTYTIGTSNQYVHVSFEEDFSIEGNNDCRYDFVTISHTSSSNTDDSPQQGPYCGSEVPAPRMLQGPVTMRFITDSNYGAHGFKANYKIIDCGGTLMSTQGVIHSPSFTTQYLDKEIDCTWSIVVPSNKVVNLRLVYMNIKVTYSCWENFVEIRDGLESGPKIVKICSNTTMQFKSTGNTLTIRYYQHSVQETRGIMAVYHSDYGPDQGCGGVKTGSSGEIQSLNLNSDGLYEPFLDCSWLLLSDAPDKVLKLTFERFDLEPPFNNSCVYDYVELRDEFSQDIAIGNGELIGRYCGSTIPTSIITSTNKMHVMFHTDSEVQKPGFKLKYESIPSPCGPAALDVKKEPQVLTSPGYPHPYPVNLNCRWGLFTNTSLPVRNRARVELNIQSLDIPCQEDYLEVQRAVVDQFRTSYYGPPQESYPLRLCSNNPAQKLFTQSDALLTFHSGPSNTVSKGFSITYQEASCNQTYSSDSGFITNPGYPSMYNFEKWCSVTISVSEGKTIAVYFNSMQLSGVESNCVNNFIEVYDGPNITDRHIGQYCGYEAPQPIFSTGNSLHFKMQTLYNMGSYSFIYMASDKGRGCGGSIFADQGTISSPLYPQPYNKSDECVWHITVPGYHTVQLSFLDFTLNSTTACESNYVEIYDGDSAEPRNRAARYCGSDAPGVHVSNSNQMLVKFVSDTTNSAPGFLLNFRLNRFAPDPSSTFMQLNPLQSYTSYDGN